MINLKAITLKRANAILALIKEDAQLIDDPGLRAYFYGCLIQSLTEQLADYYTMPQTTKEDQDDQRTA